MREIFVVTTGLLAYGVIFLEFVCMLLQEDFVVFGKYLFTCRYLDINLLYFYCD